MGTVWEISRFYNRTSAVYSLWINTSKLSTGVAHKVLAVALFFT